MSIESDNELYENAQRLLNKRQYSEALSIYETLASAGDPQCQVFSGWMYYEGLGVEKNPVKALEWFEKAAGLGSKEGAFYSGRVEMNLGQYESAITHFRIAARQEYGPALLWLGIAYIRGLGFDVDYKKGIDYLNRAAKTGNYLAQREIGILMLKGKMGFLNIPKGIFLFFYSILVGIASMIFSGKRTDQLIG